MTLMCEIKTIFGNIQYLYRLYDHNSIIMVPVYLSVEYYYVYVSLFFYNIVQCVTGKSQISVGE